MGKIIAAIDIGTSKIVAYVVNKDSFDKYSVVKKETVFPKEAILRGYIYSLKIFNEVISELFQKLKNDKNIQIDKIYVGIGGQSLRTELLKLKSEVENGKVSHQLIAILKDNARKYEPKLGQNLGIASCEYYVDDQYTSDPEGEKASVLEAQYQLIVGNPCLKGNLETAFKEINMPVAGYFISPVATAEAVLTPEEKEFGCALVEFGEGITYVSIYKHKALKFLITLPIGGFAITSDISSLNVSLEEGEALKKKYGNAFSKPTDSGDIPVNGAFRSSRTIKQSELNWAIENRVNEIVKNVLKQIQESGYSKEIKAGIVITGGGALLKDLPQFITEQSGYDVRLAKAKMLIDKVETQLSPADSCVAGIAMLGKENCGKIIPKSVDPPRPDFNGTEDGNRHQPGPVVSVNNPVGSVQNPVVSEQRPKEQQPVPEVRPNGDNSNEKKDLITSITEKIFNRGETKRGEIKREIIKKEKKSGLEGFIDNFFKDEDFNNDSENEQLVKETNYYQKENRK